MRAFSFISFLVVFNAFSQQNYLDSLTMVRKQHQVTLLTSGDSPLNQQEIQQLESLDYFPITTSNIVNATFKKKIGQPFNIPTSSGMTKYYRKYGVLTFSWNGETVTLTVYQDINLAQLPAYKDYLLIPFKDATSGNETYGGGRYLDFKIPNSKKVVLDFNTVYNPYCAYSYRYNCPIPPIENHLTLPIEAGEKTPLLKH